MPSITVLVPSLCSCCAKHSCYPPVCLSVCPVPLESAGFMWVLLMLQHRPSAGLMPIEARGNYVPEPPYLPETKTYHSQPLESIRHAGNYFVPLSIRPIFIFVVAEVMSNYLTTEGLKIFFSTSGGPLWPEARGICHICHMVNPALHRPIRPVWARGWCRISPPRFLAECCKRQLNQVSFVSL